MSRIRRLSIRGIRNFGDESDEALIQFSRPLTLILGPNGTGKTTIIEALKFATCGEFPPGSERGKFFIHDPTLLATSSVRGVVRAEIVDGKGNLYTICRTIESTKGNVTMRFKTLDSALSRINKGTKEIVSITNRCANVDTELTLAMGVSKPILDYVIFCHQEDLNWPFQDGKKLKEKFDEIFDSCKFNKALESIMKYIKDLKQKTSILKEQKQNCQLVVNEVVDKETRLEDNKKRLESSKVKIEELNKELEPINEKIKKLEKVTADYKDLQNEEEKKMSEYTMFKQQLDRLKEDLQYVFEGTTEELLTQLGAYNEILIKKVEKIAEFEEKLKNIAEDESRISNNLSAWNLDAANSNVSELEVLALTKRLTEKMRELEHKTEENRMKRDEEEKELQKVIDTLRSTHSKLDSEKDLKENEVIETRKEVNKITLDIKQLSAAGNKLNSIDLKIKEAQAKIQQLNQELDVNTVNKQVADKIKTRNKMETLLNTVDEEIALLLKQSSLQAELELNKSTLLTKEEEIEKLKNKHKEKIMILLDIKEIPQTKLKSNLDMVQKEMANEIESINQEILTEERQITTLETTILHTEHELQNKKKEVNLNKEKISSICHYKNFDEKLLLQSKKVKDLQDKRGVYAHQGAAYKEYIKQLKEINPCCPLCHRGFDERETVINLLQEMESEMENHPNRLHECEKELKTQQEIYDKMLQLKPVVEKIIQSEEIELKKLTNDLEVLKNKLNKSRTTLLELKTKRSNPENKLRICKDIIGDIILWDTYIDETFKLKQTIDNLHTRMIEAGIKTKRSLEETQTQREELKMSLKNIRDDIEKLQSRINTHNENLHSVREEQNALHEELLKIRSDMQKLKELKDKQEVLYLKEISLGKSVDTLREKVVTAETKLNSKFDELERKKKNNWEEQEIDRKLIAEGVRRLSELQKVQDEVDAFTYRKIPESLECSESKIKNYEKLLNKLLHEKGDIETMISNSKEEISRQEVRKRELSDNLTLRKTQETVSNVHQKYLSIKERLNAINYSQALNEWENLRSREQAILRQKNMIKGSQEELERTVQHYTEVLKKQEYRQARKNYKNKCIELTVVEETILNLKAYSKVLDVAMIEYHEERMATVNKIMKQMWKLVYTGTDTTCIAIRTDATEGIGSIRRTYNYKLVQIKYGHEIDMKGRCSAGQKVLASIIIRLALAETFCKDCGILALDEPTTNLDQENADSLANALATVVKLRSQYQKNFQLIVISHDEKFLFKLAELSSNKGFYQLYRKQTGYTGIKHCLVKNQDYFTSNNTKEDSSSDDEINEHSKLQDKLHSSTNLQQEIHNEQTNKKRRHVWNTDNKDSTENKPSKRRYVFQ
ncbi:PREDICTED: LOW QUALITY PROTEIN: DNA repair protein RAD50 [Eufriesea mexicana]|uniref:LOW QUALITY PROTEIN: DNA repair protein RAD50 n=1 Tax=Eufriesea mexicana TaxID=516756 RepID=UPI00083C8E37|nr:PREDICTED: LOW QUALITY PROTEIN: DNA repair protein RAD50 [Eufriesea mexicana]